MDWKQQSDENRDIKMDGNIYIIIRQSFACHWTGANLLWSVFHFKDVFVDVTTNAAFIWYCCHLLWLLDVEVKYYTLNGGHERIWCSGGMRTIFNTNIYTTSRKPNPSIYKLFYILYFIQYTREWFPCSGINNGGNNMLVLESAQFHFWHQKYEEKKKTCVKCKGKKYCYLYNILIQILETGRADTRHDKRMNRIEQQYPFLTFSAFYCCSADLA